MVRVIYVMKILFFPDHFILTTRETSGFKRFSFFTFELCKKYHFGFCDLYIFYSVILTYGHLLLAIVDQEIYYL